jgi:hypothetical protein
MIDIDESVIDVDFPTQKEYTFGDCGMRQRESFAAFEDAIELLPRSEWQSTSEAIQAGGGGLEKLVTRIYDQGNEGSCVGNATAQCIEINQARQFGEDRVVPLSAISLYKRIGRSPGSGAMLDDAYDEIRSRGVLPLDTPENRARFGNHVMPPRGFYTPFPDGWEATAKKITGIEAYVIRSVDGIATALLKQIGPVVVGRQGHSICYTTWVYKNGRALAGYANSWTPNWGQPFGDMPGGFGFDSESQINQSAGYAFCIHSVTFASDFVP